MNCSINERKQNLLLPPFKIEFEDQQKPLEIQVLNDLVKHNTNLNISIASYSKHPQSQHTLLLFVNDSATFELLLKNNSCSNLLCNLSFHLTLPRRTPTSYSVIANRIPRQWTIDTIQPLLMERYSSIIHISRIYRDNQPTIRLRIDFHSQHDVQSIIQYGYSYFDNIRYPATPYKPLTRIDRCYKYQQYVHKIYNCTNEPKCYKCDEIHTYNSNCSNPIKCANCAGSPECPVKISYRKQQQRQQVPKMINSFPITISFSSSAQLYSNVLQTVSTHINSNTSTTPIPQTSTSQKSDPSLVILNSIKDEISKSHTVLSQQLIQLQQKYETAAQQQITFQHIIDTQLVPLLMAMSDLLVIIFDNLAHSTPIVLYDHQRKTLSSLRQLSNNNKHKKSSPSINSQKSSTLLCPLLLRTQAQSDHYSSLTTISSPPHLASIPSESNSNENVLSSHNYIQE